MILRHVYIILALTSCAFAQNDSIGLTSSTPAPVHLSLSLRYEVDAALNRSLDWLAAEQKANGSWSSPKTPALTGLALWAFTRSEHPDAPKIIENALTHILSCRQKDGGFYVSNDANGGGSLASYNTAICMTALYAADRDELTPHLLRARDYVARAQHYGADAYRGGFGYDTPSGRAYTTLLSAFHTAQAMHATSGTETNRPAGKRVDINWTDVVESIEQPRLETQTNTQNIATNTITLRRYGSMTYAGLLAMIYANISPEDVRVRSALDWCMKHWSLDENPGMGKDGLYFFYNVLARALDAADVDYIRLENGTDLDWREALANKLLSLQKIDSRGRGYWQNTDTRYWENDPVLATVYSILALQLL
jgi:squalene-hopene/tetraprenyl-beta-curcumene cyclase